MTPLERIRTLMEAVGPLSEAIDTVAQTGDAAFTVVFDEDTVVLLDVLEDQQKLVLSVDLGTPAPERRLAAYQTMLCYNLAWPETGGVKMGLGGAFGPIVQMFELVTADLEAEALAGVLVRFAALARYWRRWLAEGPAADDPAPAALPAEMMIRV